MRAAYERALVAWVDRVRRLAWPVTVLCLAATVAAGLYTVREVGINTDTGDLLSKELPYRKAYQVYKDAFPILDDSLVVVVDGPSPDIADDAAVELAKALEGRPGVEAVRYPFLPSHPQHELATRQMTSGGGLVTFAVAGGVTGGRRFLNALQMCDIVANLGDVRTTATHPASTTHSGLSEGDRQAVGITPGLIRVSVGLEHIDDIIADIDHALSLSLS